MHVETHSRDCKRYQRTLTIRDIEIALQKRINCIVTSEQKPRTGTGQLVLNASSGMFLCNKPKKKPSQTADIW